MVKVSVEESYLDDSGQEMLFLQNAQIIAFSLLWRQSWILNKCRTHTRVIIIFPAIMTNNWCPGGRRGADHHGAMHLLLGSLILISEMNGGFQFVFLNCDVFIKFNHHEYMETDYLKKKKPPM